MGIHATAKALQLNMYIYRYHIMGGAFTYFAVPQAISSFNLISDIRRQLKEIEQSRIANGYEWYAKY
eukprot:403346579